MISSVYRPAIIQKCRIPLNRPSSRPFASWNERLPDPSNRSQIFTSRSNDPFINLSIEHHLFQKSPPGSKILFQYVNRPCIVIGRNQNPWLEVNLALLNPDDGPSNGIRAEHRTALGKIDLVRRRSGGGTVFHDEGNVNWSVICDFTEFTRDKHAEMVVRALRSIGVDRARVNERHDIVLDQGSKGSAHDIENTHSTAFTSTDLRPLKVSGSAYKMARNRALHHGTALLSSPNLNVIPHYLHSPAKSYISAKGVESVSSPVSNIGIENDAFMETVRAHFVRQYKVPDHVREITVDESALDIPEIRKGHDEMKSLDWTYLQTPGFTFSSEPLHVTDRKVTDKPRLTFEARHGTISDCEWTPPRVLDVDTELSKQLKDVFRGTKIHEKRDWEPLLEGRVPAQHVRDMASFLATMFPSPK